MKKHIVWALAVILFLYIGPSFSQTTEDEKYEKPQIDVISDVDEAEGTSPKSPKPKDQKEDTEPQIETPKLETPEPMAYATDRTDETDGDPTNGRKTKARKRDREREQAQAQAPPVISETVIEKSEPVVETPQEVKPAPQEVVPPQPNPTAQPTINPTPPQPEPVQTPQAKPVVTPQAQPVNQPQGQPNVGQPGRAPVPPQTGVGQQQPNVNVQQGRVPVQNANPNPTQPNQGQTQPPVQQQQQQPPQPVPQKPVQQPPQQPTQHIPPPVQEVPVAKPVEPVNVVPEKDIYTQTPPVQDTHEHVKPQKLKPSAIESVMDEDEYMRLLENEGNKNYLEQYTIYSDTFFAHLERFFKDSVFPVYTHVRSNPELSLGFSTLIVIYLINLLFKLLGRMCRKKPKFVYNKEEAISQADISNNFKKFVAELENLKKQIDANSKKAGSAPAAAADSGAGAATVSATIPQNLQNDIAYIAQNISKNEESLNKFAKDKKQLDSFLFEFQKEVVESHKAIWNELYQLRKVFSSSRLTTSTKTRSDAKDTDDTKSLSSNPETNENRRENQRESVKKGAEPRSRSVADSNSSANALRSRQPAQKEKKEVVEPEKPAVTAAPTLQNGEAHAAPVHHNREEEPEVRPQSLTHTDKTAHPGPFGKAPKEEEAQPEVQIPTNLSNNAPTMNPFATSTQAAASQGPTGQNAVPTVTPGGLNVTPKTIPFGVKGRPPVLKQPVVQTTFSHPPEPVTEKSGAKVEGNTTEVTSSRELKATTPITVQNTMPPVESQPEEKAAVTETDNTFEETKASEQPSRTDEALASAAGEEESGDGNVASRPGFVPPMRGPGPMGGPPGGPPGQRKAIIPNNKALPIPGKRPGLPPGANVFKGPPGNIPRPGGPMQIKQPQGQVQGGEVKTGSQV